MPELPEVETLVRALRPHLEGRRLRSWKPLRQGLRQPFPPEAGGIVPRHVIRRVWRRAKYLLLELGTEWLLIFHLGMTGHLRICPASEPLDRHDHLVCGLDADSELRFNDPRRFGIVALHHRTSRNPLPDELTRLGPEPLDPAFTEARLGCILAGSGRPLKTLLLDQESLAGLGNIYCCEALFRAGINPATPANSLSRSRVRSLHRAIRTTLRRAIEAGSTMTPETPTPEAWFPFAFQVYGRDGEPCPRCRSTPILRRVQAGRSTFFCPRCQAD